MKTDNKTLVEALRILAKDIDSEDGIANACIEEAANRIEELNTMMEELKELSENSGISILTVKQPKTELWNYVPLYLSKSREKLDEMPIGFEIKKARE